MYLISTKISKQILEIIIIINLFQMNRLALSIGALIATVANAAEEEYTRFADYVSWYEGYTWEAVNVTTEDGFILTTFHITGNSDGLFTPTRPPVLIQHGDHGDGAEWFDSYDEGLPMHLQLAEAGYDVWIGSNRGTDYS